MKNETPQLICEEQEEKRTKKNLLVCSYKIGSQPGKHISNPIKLILQRKYFKERSRLHKILDVLVLTTLVMTSLGLILLSLPKSTPDFIQINASIAPEEIITGGSSTLTFTYENKSNEIIRNAILKFDLPKNFQLIETTSADSSKINSMEFDLGDINPTEYGTIHIKGTMFGDIGGEQIFKTILNYQYGEDNISDEKIIEHIFSPAKSTLTLNLKLPEYMVAGQKINGQIEYTNTGDITFPDIIINPQWPASFQLLLSNPSLQTDDAFHIKGIAPTKTGIINFTGILGEPNDSIFIFHPAFEFNDVKYKQEILKDTIRILPSPLAISISAQNSVITPSDNSKFDISYSNIGDYELTNVRFRINSNENILSTANINQGYYYSTIIDKINSNETGTVTITIPTKSSFPSSLGTNIILTATPSVEFSFKPDGQNIITNTFGDQISIPVTSPIVLQSFGRYWTSDGDQLGRGFLPPRINEKTKIWIFWNITGTTNDLSNLKIEASLGSNVIFTGRQSVSIGSPVYSNNGNVIWDVGDIPPTNNGKVIGAAFEVELTPTEDQLNTTPILIYAPYVSASDNFTNAIISDAGSSITTYLSSDTKAIEYGGVVEN